MVHSPYCSSVRQISILWKINTPVGSSINCPKVSPSIWLQSQCPQWRLSVKEMSRVGWSVYSKAHINSKSLECSNVFGSCCRLWEFIGLRTVRYQSDWNIEERLEGWEPGHGDAHLECWNRRVTISLRLGRAKLCLEKLNDSETQWRGDRCEWYSKIKQFSWRWKILGDSDL